MPREPIQQSGNLLTPMGCSACRKAIAAANEALPFITRLREIAEVYPAIGDVVNELETRRQYLHDGARATLGIDREASPEE